MKEHIPLILRFVFGGLLVFAVLVFAGVIPHPKSASEDKTAIVGSVTIWGTFGSETMGSALNNFFSSNQVRYIQKDPETFNHELLSAIASGSGPDIILLPQDLIIKRAKSIQRLPYSFLPKRKFKNTYISQGQVYLRPEGVLALPFYIDPLVMYWNTDMFTQAGYVQPPEYWDDIYDYTPVLTERKDDGTIMQSAIAFGEYRNVTNAKAILSLLMLQRGNPIVTLTPGGALATLSGVSSAGIPSVKEALEFYTNFSDPRLSKYYSWNRGLPDSRQMFLEQNLAMYFGFASEYARLKQMNPHLNFRVSVVPQIRDAKFDATYGEMYGVALLATSDNKKSAYQVMFTLGSAQFSRLVSEASFLPPVHRSFYVNRPQDNAVRSVFYDSALISRGWPDPAPEETSRIFQDAIESISSESSGIPVAVKRMQEEFGVLLNSILSVVPVKEFLARVEE